MTDGSRPRRPAGLPGRGDPRRGDPPRRGVPPLPGAPETGRPELPCDLGPEWDAAESGRPPRTELPRRRVLGEGPPGPGGVVVLCKTGGLSPRHPTLDQ